MKRREFLKYSVLGALQALLLGPLFSSLKVFAKGTPVKATVYYRIDPEKCTACGACAAVCLKKPIPPIQAYIDNEKCIHCGECPAYYVDTGTMSEAASNLTCKVKAMGRWCVYGRKYDYGFDLDKCLGCGSCVRLCKLKCNNALRLQVDNNSCLHCEKCLSKEVCPNGAFMVS